MGKAVCCSEAMITMLKMLQRMWKLKGLRDSEYPVSFTRDNLPAWMSPFGCPASNTLCFGEHYTHTQKQTNK